VGPATFTAAPTATAAAPASIAPAGEASLVVIAGTTTGASPETSVTSAASAASAAPAASGPSPSHGSGVDPGLLIAAVAGGGLGGLAMLRLAAARRRAL
jgi:hypothetical protein